MLDYKKLRKEFIDVLSKIDETKIESWLKFDEERMMNENFIIFTEKRRWKTGDTRTCPRTEPS
jgi:hypothetical protein